MEHYDLQTSPPVLLLRKKCVELTTALKTVKALKKKFKLHSQTMQDASFYLEYYIESPIFY